MNDRDLRFFDVMLASLRQKFPVDDRRIYAAGFSNGASFSYLLWAERGKLLAAFALVAGKLDTSERLRTARAALIIGGQNDPSLPFSDQQRSMDLARQINNTTAPGQPCGAGCTFYPSPSGTPVVTCIHNDGHSFPPWAASAIVEFFKLHKL
ncbi:MAG TPA: hypothetical protein VKH81_17880 [Candidatus Angelobacter sp.]|nr:hypothetical protein [Candidatus Angelobacter sp.]